MRTSAEMAGELGPFPEYAANRDAHAARDAQPSPRRSWRDDRLREARDPARAAGSRRASTRSTLRMPRSAPGTMRSQLGERVRLSQRAGDRDRANRHDRSRHGLRHHRRRTRFRAGEVQEAGRRRLLQDHQPLRARSAAPRSATTSRQIDDIIAYAVGHGTLEGADHGPHPRRAARQGFGDEQIDAVEASLESAFDIRFVFNKWTLGEEFCTEVLKIDPGSDGRAGFRPAEDARLLQGRRSTPPTCMSAER